MGARAGLRRKRFDLDILHILGGGIRILGMQFAVCGFPSCCTLPMDLFEVCIIVMPLDRDCKDI